MNIADVDRTLHLTQLRVDVEVQIRSKLPRQEVSQPVSIVQVDQ